MRSKTLAVLVLFPISALLLSTRPAASQDLPGGVTEKMISDGVNVYKGSGLCFACHGPEAKGIPGLGADLTDSEWIHLDGSYENIVELITSGTTSAAGVAMPPKGAPQHGGASGRYRRYEETAREYAFIVDLSGIEN